MNTTQRRNLAKPASIECRTRIKLIKSVKDAMTAMNAPVSEAIKTLNNRKPMQRIRAIHGADISGTAMLESASNLQGDIQWIKCLKDIEQLRVALQRKILIAELCVAGELGISRANLGDLDDFDFDDMEDGEEN